ncbi:MAG: hypothetical protein WAU00_20715, partial [Caldilinea sp.]
MQHELSADGVRIGCTWPAQIDRQAGAHCAEAVFKKLRWAVQVIDDNIEIAVIVLISHAHA